MKTKKIIIIFITLIKITSIISFGYQSEVISRQDGSLIYFYLQKGKRTNLPLVLVLQGSNPERCREFLSHIIELLGEQFDANFLLIEKYGAQNNTFNFFSEEFLRHNTPLQRVEDSLVVLEHLKGLSNNWSGELILLAGSEGGTIANLIAPRYKNTTMLINIAGGGGMTMAEELTVLNNQGIFNITGDQFEAEMHKVREEPIWQKTWLGESNTHLYWSQMLDILPLDHIRNYTGKMLVFHGVKDDSAPIESSDLLVAQLNDPIDIQYHRVEDLDHKTILEYAIPFIQEWFFTTYGIPNSCNP